MSILLLPVYIVQLELELAMVLALPVVLAVGKAASALGGRIIMLPSESCRTQAGTT